MASISGIIKKRIAGALLIALGILALTTPLVAGRWSLAVLGLPLITMGIAEAYIAFTSSRGTDASRKFDKGSSQATVCAGCGTWFNVSMLAKPKQNDMHRYRVLCITEKSP